MELKVLVFSCCGLTIYVELQEMNPKSLVRCAMGRRQSQTVFSVSWEDSDSVNRSMKGGSSESGGGSSGPSKGTEPSYSRSVSDCGVQ